MSSAAEEFDSAYFDRLRAARDHWWVRGMQVVAAAVLAEAPPRSGRVLDAGCGSGALLEWEQMLVPAGRVAGMDIAPQALADSRAFAPDVPLLRGSVTSLPFGDGRFDLVVSMDVLQHLPVTAEGEALAEFARVLRPGGRILLRTNAAFGRGGIETREEWRLYDPAGLRDALSAAGLEVERVTAANFVLGAAATLRERAGHRPRDDHDDEQHRPEWQASTLGIPTRSSRAAGAVFERILRAEARWLRSPRRSLPFGHSLYALARRPG